MAERSYPVSEVRGGSQEELPSVRGQWQLGGATLLPRSGEAAKRSYPASEVRGSQEETPQVQGQGQPGEATWHQRPGAVTLRSHPEPEARGSSWVEPPTPKARARGQEEHPEERWLRRPRRA